MSAGRTAVAPPARRWIALGAGVLLALAVLSAVSVLAAQLAGAQALELLDAGPLARRGAPAASLVGDLAGAVMLGGAVLAGWVLREREDIARAMLLVTVASVVTTLARGIGLLFSYALATGQQIGAERFGSDITVFVATDIGVWLLAAVLVAAAATTLSVTGAGRGIARSVTVLAGVVAFCAAMTGHAAGGSSHEVATSTMLVHLLAVGLWVGGLAVLQMLPARSRDDARVVRGYSHLALICWVALALSGIWALAVRMNSPSELLTSTYVQLGDAKAVLLIALGVLGAMQRRQIAADLAGGASAGGDGTGMSVYRRLAIIELALMGLAVALAAAMSNSAPPAQQGVPPSGPAGLLTSYPLPDAPTLGAVLTAWRPAPFFLALGCALVLLWWRPRGPRRPRGATIRLLLGLAATILLTSGPLAVYGKVLASAHALQHLLLLAAGALLATVLLPGPDRPLREVVLSRPWSAPLVTRIWAGPPLAGLGTAALIGVYVSTPLLRMALESHAAHLALLLLAMSAGALITVAVRCSPRPAAVLLAPFALLIAAGAVMGTIDVLMQASWFGATGRTWMRDALADQQHGGIAVLVVAALGTGAGMLALRRR